jgi:hypothetical protein
MFVESATGPCLLPRTTWLDGQFFVIDIVVLREARANEYGSLGISTRADGAVAGVKGGKVGWICCRGWPDIRLRCLD